MLSSVMKHAAVLLLTLLAACKPAAPTAGPQASSPGVKMTFFVSGLECVACAESVRPSVGKLAGVSDIKMREGLEGYANVTFDPATVSAQQIAQAVYDAQPLHGTPYEASLLLKIPAYTQPALAAQVDTIIAKQKAAITTEPHWEAKDQLIVRFLPLEIPASPPQAAQGWNPQHLSEALGKRSLTCSWVAVE